jgi:hypothetical protein
MQKITLPRVAALAFCLVAFSVALDARAATGFAGRINALIEAEVLGPSKADEPAPTPTPRTVEPPPPANLPLQIAGQPVPVATVGTTWRFQPEAMYGNGPALIFSAVNTPPWATLDATTGWLVGTPAAGDVGNWGPVSIRVTDGVDSAALPEFSITVQASHAATGSAELSWAPPTQRTDGAPLGELAGYRILYGTASGKYDQSADIDNPGVTTFLVEHLAPGRWYFAVTAISAERLESAPSAEVVSDES